MDRKALEKKLTETRQAATQIKDSLRYLSTRLIYYADVLSGDTGETLDAKSLDCIHMINKLSEEYLERLENYNDALRDIEWLKEDIYFLENE